MIKSFRQSVLRDFYVDDRRSKGIPAPITDRLFRKLQLIDDASSGRDLRSPPGNRFERLVGKMKGWCSIRVNRQWRLIFKWDEEYGEASQIYLDPHEYR
jgi:proteic killer suppression protein